ncbi:MAG TPA: asparagine synthase (glutamine-hydrolyzing) [Baekduia sp.]|jgi:asparagine synthase (glutamine-hydrolysing)
MCGIAGLVRFGGAEVGPEDLRDLERAGRAVAHRGPDGGDVACWGSVGVSFRRLAVYDIAGGRQPMWNEDHTVGLMVNGTIYNHDDLRRRLTATGHAFRTASDCEPLVHLYEESGPDLVEDLLGMFAFALWDLRRGRLLLGRDRLGLKPLFWTADDRRLLFGSEIKALLAFEDCPRELDWAALLADPSLNNAAGLDDRPPQSGFRDIHQLPGGALLDVDLASGAVRERRYWTLPEPDPSLDPRDAADRYEQLLLDAVDVCLTGEAEIGLALSGGVDSAIVAGRAGQRHPVPTFTVVGTSTQANGDASGAFAIAEHAGLPHVQVLCDTEELLQGPDRWASLVWRTETALCSPEQLLKEQLFRAARATVPGLKVMLSGIGGDEFAGGYCTTLVPHPGAGWPDFVTALGRLEARERRRCDPVLDVWDSYLGAGAVSRPGGHAHDHDPYRGFLRYKQRDLLMYNLWCEDRLASAMSIEARAPYLDHRLVELLATIPPAARSALLWDKRILRDAGRSVLPERLRERRKVPFFHGAGADAVYRPFARMLHADGYALLEAALDNASARQWVDLDRLTTVVDGLQAPGATSAVGVEMALRIVNMGLLDQLARSGGGVADRPPTAPVQILGDWADLEARARAEATTHPPRRELGDLVLRFCPGADLVRSERQPARHLLTVGGRARFEVVATDPWLGVLRGIDGVAPLGVLCAAADTTTEALRDYVETALEHGILAVAAEHDPVTPGAEMTTA